MTSEAYRKVGRGGAGNYYSPQNIEEIRRKATEDLEAQPRTPADQLTADENRPEYVHSGRGGAGNYEATSTIAERQREINVTPSLKENPVSSGGFYGRGGAGNLRTGEEQKQEDLKEQSNGSQAQSFESPMRDVDMGLKAPERAHLGAAKHE